MPEHATKNHVSKIVYRMVPAMRLLRGRHPCAAARAPSGFVRLTATRLHRAVTILIDWDRAVDKGWPRLQPPSSQLARQFRRPVAKRYAGFPWPAGKSMRSI